jgi:hypothetical protein
MNAHRKVFLAGAVVALGVGTCFAQRQRGGRGGYMRGGEEDGGSYVRTEGGVIVDENTVRTARETASHSTGTPNWTNPPGFEKDVFTFARILFKNGSGNGGGWGRGFWLGWWVDYPDADLNFSYRLQQMTSTKVDPDGRVLRLTDPSLADFPVIYMEHVESMRLSATEVDILRRYLLNGGALFINDTWNDLAWQNFEAEMRRVLSGRAWTELTMEHPVFHSIFDLKGPMNALQVPTIRFWNGPGSGGNSPIPLQNRDRGPGSENVHVRAMLDDKGHIMVIAINNSDVSDGWEREGEDSDYFHSFSEKISYPLGLNIVFYLMTH